MTDYNKPPVLKKLSLFFIFIVLALLLLVVYYFIGWADIVITPSIKPIQTSFEISIRPAVDATDGSEMPGSIIAENTEISRTFQVTDATEEIPGLAGGEITIVNTNSSDQTLVATTRFLTPDGFLFRLDELTVIPSGSQVTASITADQEGAKGDIAPPMRLSIPGLSEALQQRIYGDLKEPLTGGIIKRGILSQSDIDGAKASLMQDLREGFQKEYLSNFLLSKTTTTPVVAPDLFIDVDLISESLDAEPGDKVNEFTYTVNARIEGVAIKKSDLEIIAQNRLKASLAENDQYMGTTPGSFKASLKSIDAGNDLALLEVAIAGQSIYTSDDGLIDKSALIGKDEDELLGYLSKVPGVKEAEVKFRPFWVRQVPPIKKNISIKVENIR